LNLEGREKGASINMTLQRQGMTLKKTLHLRDYPAPAMTRDGRKPGLNFSIYRGRSGLQSGLTGVAPSDRGELSSISVDEIKGREKENFAVAFEGYLEFPEAGLYRIWLGADDGAELFLDGRLVIDNGLNHPYQELSRTVLAPKGLVPLRLEYFQGRGEARLTLAVRPDGSAASDPAMELNFWRDVREAQR
jgi:hexosaminidase